MMLSVVRSVVVILTLAFSTSVYASESITLAVGEWPPYLSQELKNGGPTTRLVKQAFANSGVETQIQWLPWPRALRRTAKAQFAATFPWYESTERSKSFLYSDPIQTESGVIFHRKGFQFDWNKLADLQPYRIGANTSYFYSEEFARMEEDGELNVTRADTEQQLIEMLVKGRLDIFLMAKTSGLVFIEQAGEKGEIVHHPKPVHTSKLYVLFPKEDPKSLERIEAFNAGFRKLQEEKLQ